MIILKIGGSSLTNKDSSESEVNFESLERIALEIKSSLDNGPKQLIIVHGAGSFGHPPAKKYKIGEAFDESEYPQKRIGFCETQNAVKKLNMHVCEAFIKQGLPVVAIPASSFMTAK
ncbi:isopentenyl phosphate kinase, partial [Methanobrevibacter sp.]